MLFTVVLCGICITDVQGVGTFPFRLFIVHTEDTALTGFDAPTQNNVYGC